MHPNTLIAPICPFPNVYWWGKTLGHQKVFLDAAEHFEKMSLRNRYMIANATGVLSLSIPLAQGRQQRNAMQAVLIDNNAPWQQQHFRSIKTAYNRSPYFEYFEHDIQALFATPFEKLVDFSLATITLTAQLMGQKLAMELKSDYLKNYDDSVLDIRRNFKANQYATNALLYPTYAQVFEDRLGFLPNLSILDLLFAEGKNAKNFLK